MDNYQFTRPGMNPVRWDPQSLALMRAKLDREQALRNAMSDQLNNSPLPELIPRRPISRPNPINETREDPLILEAQQMMNRGRSPQAIVGGVEISPDNYRMEDPRSAYGRNMVRGENIAPPTVMEDYNAGMVPKDALVRRVMALSNARYRLSPQEIQESQELKRMIGQ